MPVRKLYVRYIPTYLKSMDVCMVQIKPATASVFFDLVETGKAIHEKKENKNQKANNKTVSCDAEYH